MSLVAGTRLGPYEIQAAIGAGGMGEVYKARDTRLDRTVAIKVLPAELSADPERRARFEREARAVAALAHPHICTLFDVGEHPSTGSGQATLYLVMEHLAGESLAERLLKGRLPLGQALSVAIEIADALTAAHKQAIIHRDLKPGNVMLTKSGAKLLDFGLAKLKGHGAEPALAPGAEAPGLHRDTAPTRSAPLTAEGTIVGTLQYMAPEQLEGKEADARTDLWALGAILYEMLTGTRAFEGASAASLITAIMSAEPPALATLQPLTPRALDRLVRRCLAKSPDDRPDTAHDVAEELRWMHEASGTGPPTAVQAWHRRIARAAVIVGGGLAMAFAGAGVMWLLRAPAPPLSVTRPSLDVRPAEELNAGGVVPVGVSTPGGSRTALAWTPDGQALVFVGQRGGVRQLYVRRLDGDEARPIPGTEGAQVPAVSPDGDWVAFWAAATIRKVPIDGGPVMDRASGVARCPMGLAWSSGGELFFGGDDGRIWAIPVQGAPAAVTTVGETEVRHILPWPLPDGRTLLYTVRKRNSSWGDEEIVAHTLATGTRTVLLRDAADARYLPTGHLVFLRRGQLRAVPFDPERLKVRGDPVAVLDGIAQALTGGNPYDITGAGQFAVASTGMLAWVPGAVAPYQAKALVMVDRRGQVTRLPVEARSFNPIVRLAPAGRELAVVIAGLTERGLYVCDLTRGTIRPLVRDGESGAPEWFPDGRRVAFAWISDGRRSIAAQTADGGAQARVLVAGEFFPSSFTPDGRQLAASRGREDIVIVTVEDGQARAQSLIATPSTESWAAFSPDGDWLAYASNASGRFDVYVQPYPGPGKTEPVSVDGGRGPAWNANGRELFFVTDSDATGRGWMMAADFAAGSPPRIGRPYRLFEFSNGDLALDCFPTRCFDVAPDGQRFYAVANAGTPAPLPVITHINLVQNWFEELKAKVPAGGAK
jgi:serine/threonine-protein kinase